MIFPILLTIIVLDGLAFIAFCTAIYLRKTCTPGRQKDVRTALRIAYVCMFVLGVICVATIGASPASARSRASCWATPPP